MQNPDKNIVNIQPLLNESTNYGQKRILSYRHFSTRPIRCARIIQQEEEDRANENIIKIEYKKTVVYRIISHTGKENPARYR